MTDRVACIVPGCRRTRPAGDFEEWICARHWPAVPKRFRQRLFRFRRRAKQDPRWHGPEQRMWVRCREAAINEALMGVTP